MSTSTDVAYNGDTNPLILTCNISIDSAFDSFVNISVTWLRGITTLSNNTDRIQISSLSRSNFSFISSLTLLPPSFEDNANFTCRASAIPSGGLDRVTASDFGEGRVAVAVQGKCSYAWLTFVYCSYNLCFTFIALTTSPPTLPPVIPPPPFVQTFLCSIVVWYNPEVPCDVINGYSVRFFHPQGEHQNVTRYLGTNGTFYVIKDEDIAEINNATSVQVGM